MRIHGNLFIRRSEHVKYCSNYENYREQLEKDFGHICGYCGKPEFATKNSFEIDHFEPQTLSPSLKCNYNNLVYSCFQCNRKKGKKWPTEKSGIHNDGSVGFVDPASSEYDEHLEREESGRIKSKTPIGEYMLAKVFKFNLRPMEEIWKLAVLKQKLEKLGESDKDKILYADISKEIFSLFDLMFKSKE